MLATNFHKLVHIEQAMPLTLRDEPYVWADWYNRKKKKPAPGDLWPAMLGGWIFFLFFFYEISRKDMPFPENTIFR
jgi:hypothetical protein